MTQEEFLRNLVKLRAEAKRQRGQITKEQVDRFFIGSDITPEQLSYVYDYFNNLRGVKLVTELSESKPAKKMESVSKNGRPVYTRESPEDGQKRRIARIREILEAPKDTPDIIELFSEMYMDEVEDIARLYEGQGVPRDDLIGEGNVAVVIASRSLELCETPEEVEALVVRMVMNAMENVIIDESAWGDEALQILKRVNEVNDRAKELSEDLNRRVTVEEIALELDTSPEHIQDIMKLTGDQIEYIHKGDNDEA